MGFPLHKFQEYLVKAKRLTARSARRYNEDKQIIQLSAAGDNLLLKARPPADRRGAQMKAPSERAPRGKYAGGVLELSTGVLTNEVFHMGIPKIHESEYRFFLIMWYMSRSRLWNW